MQFVKVQSIAMIEKISDFCSEIFSINLYSTGIAYVLLVICLIFVEKFRSYIPVILILSSEIILAALSVNWIYNIFEDFSYITRITLVLQVFAVILLFVFVHNSSDLYLYAIITVISSSGAGIFMFWHARKYVNLHFVFGPSIEHLKSDTVSFFNNHRNNNIHKVRDYYNIGVDCRRTYSVGLYKHHQVRLIKL